MRLSRSSICSPQEHTANARVASSSGIGAIIVVESFEILQRGGGTNNAQICLESFYSRLSHAVDYWGQHSVNDGGHDLPVSALLYVTHITVRVEPRKDSVTSAGADRGLVRGLTHPGPVYRRGGSGCRGGGNSIAWGRRSFRHVG